MGQIKVCYQKINYIVSLELWITHCQKDISDCPSENPAHSPRATQF